MNPWVFVYEAFEPEKESLREALCTLGNGFFATRGAVAESEADEIHYPGTYLAGGYNRLRTEMAGRVIENEDLVNLPNWLPLTFRIDPAGSWFRLMAVEILSYRQELDIRKGLLLRTVRFRDKQGRETTMRNRRLVHMQNPHLAAQETTLIPENWSGPLEVCSGLDGRVINAGVKRYRALNSKHLEPLGEYEIDEESFGLEVRTTQSRLRIDLAARTRVFVDRDPLEVERKTDQEPGYMAQFLVLAATKGQPVVVEKVVSLYTSRDRGISESKLQARKTLSGAGGFDDLLESHTRAWEHLWRRFEFRYEPLDPVQGARTGLILNLYLFHLLQTTSLHTRDLDVGVPSRGWHGEAYRGHIFWDELFIFPILNLRMPEVTRSLLLYRFRRLDEARTEALEAGYRGAMYPWQSGSSGREETQKIHLNPKSGRWLPDNSSRQRHVNAAIAYNIWHYYQVTNDTEFLVFYGAEMLLEIARFWASIATYNEELGRYEILGVMGPDEYHDGYPGAGTPGLNNNAYTNVMAVWVLSRALKLFDVLDEVACNEICEKILLRQEEKERWSDISRRMRIVFHDEGIISQFEGYDRLEEFDWEGYRGKYKDIQRLDRILEEEGDSTNRYKVSKQADLLMLFYLFSSEELKELFDQLGYPFEPETIPKNINYYMQGTSHGSTLSRVVHSWVLARSDRIRSWGLFAEALESDVADIQGGTTPEGIHLGAMAGTADILQRAYTGLETREDILWLNPVLPEGLGRLHMHIRYRNHSLEMDVVPGKLTIEALPCAAGPIRIGFKNEVFELKMGETKEFGLA